MKYENPKYFADEAPGKTREISILINSIFYFIGNVFILTGEGNYRLVANHNGKLLMDKPYKTLRGAKIAFSRKFSRRGWRKGLKAQWSLFYEPDAKWLNQRKADN